MVEVVWSYRGNLFMIIKQSKMLSEKERKKYHKWRLRILFSVILGYATYYLCRQNFSVIMPIIMTEFNYSKTQMGYILALSSMVYGIGKFINGYISDKSNARYFMPIGLFISAIISFSMGFMTSLYAIGILWCFNNWFQSMGWPPVARILTHWFAKQEIGVKWAYGSASHQVGGAFTLVFTSYLANKYGWQFGFFIPAIIAIVISYLLFFLLRESPKSVGLIDVERYKQEAMIKKRHMELNDNYYHYDDNLDNNTKNINHNTISNKDSEEDHLSTADIISKVFLNINIWYIGFANMFLYIVRFGVISWGPLYLKKQKLLI
ncbi:MAG TPA: MFS transporter [Candidatus Megaira endosymbiont of Hartmannula sinica]|nr:MFS transporter [Candidatus Megaera endosymbiont of Hartmannula sinica]